MYLWDRALVFRREHVPVSVQGALDKSPHSPCFQRQLSAELLIWECLIFTSKLWRFTFHELSSPGNYYISVPLHLQSKKPKGFHTPQSVFLEIPSSLF